MLMLLAATAVQAQITIAGNVYGGGNAGNLGGSTNVKVYAGRLNGSVFGGARQADVAGCTYVNIDGEHISDTIIINTVYGGNDISGTIGSLEAINSSLEKPDSRIDQDGHHGSGTGQSGHSDHGGLKDVSTFVLTTPERTVTQSEGITQPHIFIGRLFGGGNGDYRYTVNSTDAYKWDVTLGEDNIIRGIDKPHVARTYVDLHGGTFGSAYAGGNNATVTRAANICINNTSTPWKLAGADNQVGTTDDVISDADLQGMGINTEFFNQMGKYNFSSVFGGNNKAAMSIRPSWHLNNGSIENLYSGGNEGAMNSPDGILLVVQPDEGGDLTVTNVFAGCRKAPVRPLLDNGQEPEVGTIAGYKFPSGLAARVLIYGGDITNVYGGNDITGRVSGGSAIGIYSSIKGCVYGGGNGSYAYTDNPALKTSPKYGDFYYNVDSLLKQKYDNWKDGDFASLSDTEKSFKSAEALNLFRPNAEQVSLRLWGTEEKPTVIGGAVYLGGNSATLKPVKSNYRIELKIGSHVYSDSVFLANNGASMIRQDVLERYNSTVKDVNNEDQNYSKMVFTSTSEDATDLDETSTGKTTFAKYMDGVVMEAGPRVVFDGEDENDPDTYKDYSTYFGSLYCGGNVGSMRNNATTEINVNYKVIIFDKLVGGSNKALVPAADGLNVEYRGGLLGLAPNGAPKLRLNLSGLKLQPKRWKNVEDKSQLLEWNTWIGNTKDVITSTDVPAMQTGKDYNTTDADLQRRFRGGNIYGGCYESGHVNGDVVINVNGSLVDRDGTYGVFDSVAEDTLGEATLYGHQHYNIMARRSGVILDEQGMDVLGTALNLFAGGYGKDSEIWGRTTVNLNRGYMFQIFGGSEQGVIGKSLEDGATEGEGDGDGYTFNGKTFKYNPAYSTVINVHGSHPGASKRVDSSEDMAEAEFIYGGGFEGPIMGNTRINLGHGRVFNTFAGSCNADILGYTETYIGQWTEGTGANATTITGFPWVRDYTYGGNDLGGLIMRTKNYADRLNEGTLEKVYGYNSETNTNPYLLTASAYTEYKQGRVGGIFGGCYGDYDYSKTGPYWNRIDGDDDHKKLPYMSNAFVNLSPLADNDNNKANYLGEVYGAGQGRDGDRRGDKMQDFSYVLVDMPNTETFKDAVVFGAGSFNGLGMRQVVEASATTSVKDQASAVVDLINGKIRAAYGGSYKQGITRRTVVNVPAESTININNIFGGAYGTMILPPCDVYETNVNYFNTSENARVTGAIFGGNNNERRSIYTHVNITSPVWSNKEKGYLGTVYGAGKGVDTWSEYTEVNLERGAKVYEVYGGGQMGHVLNAESVEKFISLYTTRPSDTIAVTDPKWKDPTRWVGGKVGGTTGALKPDYLTEWKADWQKAWTLDGYYDPTANFSASYVDNAATNFTNVTARPELDEETAELFKNKTKFNTHVIIQEGAVVEGYAYGGGLGADTISLSGDTYGTTYIALLGGVVKKDLYAAGTAGGVYDLFDAKNFTASANAYIQGGTARNVYGGGWKGNVGRHTGTTVNGKYYAMAGVTTKDIDGETNVVIGIHQDKKNSITGYGFTMGEPAIQRNAYGGGEGGAVFGTANLTLRNGYVGYVHLDAGKMQDEKGEVVVATDYDPSDEKSYPARFEAKLNDETYYDKTGKVWLGSNSLLEAGSLYGGGYIDNSSVDVSNVTMYGGQVRTSVFGGGEIAAVGRAVMNNGTPTIYKAGKTNVFLYEGHVGRNVFGGGRGYNNLGTHGTLDCDGYIFGQTEVHVRGGEVGTMAGVAKGDGNVFGGGDVGYVYSAYNIDGEVAYGKKSGVRYDGGKEGYYYKYENGAFVNGYPLTEDCKVVIEPWAKATGEVTVNGNTYTAGKYVPTEDLNHLSAKNGTDSLTWKKLDASGIVIHNAVFAGGNTSAGSSTANANTPSVFGNATASIHDVYHRDLITMGTGYTGGLYGDGNLTLVDGYRELNITNYGTDYYTIESEITIEQYNNLPDRESAYYELRYTCLKECKDKDGTIYKPENENSKASTIRRDDLLTLFLQETTNGYVSVKYNDVDVLVYDNNEGWIPNTAEDAKFWKESGVLPVYAGRLMNSIQRADFCGVFGSRMVMQGARDRVPEITDFTNYTINRVREVSLNQQHSLIAGDKTLNEGKTPADPVDAQDPDDYLNLDRAIHGNYFGIYSNVNYLGALTSDVHFKPGTVAEGGEDKRRTSNTDTQRYGLSGDGDDVTYYQWKSKHIKDQTRNNGSSFNKVALASGVYLELTSEKSTGKELNEKDWGYITGVVELDLINVQTGIGGGFVYAKNEHRVGRSSGLSQVTLTALNDGAVTRKSFTYDGDLVEWETSGNFVHSTQTIIDDCYNISGKYSGDDAVPAHYWYIKGSVYVYDQYISAYTGAPNAYSETVDIPLTITAASHGTMKLVDVKPNLYAYYASQGVVLENDKKLIINDITYYKNDPISYWDWYKLSTSEKNLFVPLTYVTVADCTIGSGNVAIPEGTVMLPGTATTEGSYEYYENLAQSKALEENGPEVKYVHNTTTGKDVPFDEVFRMSNNLSHDTGYLLTYKVNNPSKWDTWYTLRNDANHSKEQKPEEYRDYEDGPTYRLTTTGDGEVLGQRDYEVGDIISKSVEDGHKDIRDNHADWITDHAQSNPQATFEPAYIVTNEAGISSQNWNYGYTIKASAVADKQQDGSYTVKSEYAGSVAPAFICTSTIQMDKAEFIYLNSKMSGAEKDGYVTRVNTAMNKISAGAGDLTTIEAIKTLTGLTKEKKDTLLSLFDLKNDIKEKIQPAYYCTVKGDYGGKWYTSGVNYRGLEAWSSMSPDDREKFTFNYDALDLLIDPGYSRGEKIKYQYDDPLESVGSYDEDSDVKNSAGYSIKQPVDYTATYIGENPLALTTAVSVIDSTGTFTTLSYGNELLRKDYESLPNEQRHYSGIVVKNGKLVDGNYHVYVVKNDFQIGTTPYAVGTVIDPSTYTNDMSSNVTELVFPSTEADKVYYYCRERYEIGENGSGVEPDTVSIQGADTNAGIEEVGTKKYVKVGTIIASGNGTGQYGSLPNKQKNFVIHGIAPTETSTLYVSRQSDIFDLSKEKIITAIYQYDYEESDTYGNITPVSERHVVNIHINFKSGVPFVEDIKAPQLVLPGSKVGLREPNVTPGAYEVTGGGWELFRTPTDAESHVNGQEYNQATDSLFWYQNDYYVAYYAKTYLGKTYSNAVQVSVANYHDLKKVMEAKQHHYYIDHHDVKREPKIYINDYTKDASGSKNGLDLLKQLYDLSVLNVTESDKDDNGLIKSGDFKGHKPLESQVRGGDFLEFIMRTNVDHTGTTWTPIGSGENDPCFAGTLHGDGYYLSGLDNSLFEKLCGQVYNLGVTGSFTSAGVANTGDGYVENCWINTTASSGFADGVRAVFGNPTRNTPDKPVQIANCYYQTGKNYSTDDTDNHGLAKAMPDSTFYNGEVAYNLNGFYLNKRYYDHSVLNGSPVEYKYLPANADGMLPTDMSTGSYPASYAYYPLKENAEKTYGYVENRFANGDYIYAGGSIPDNVDERIRVVKETVGNQQVDVTYYAPIWPDDYIYFGQALNYGHVEGRTHQDVPSHIAKSSERLDLTETGNRIYRAPAYFRNSEMRVAHFNPYAVFAKSKKNVSGVKAYENMTAIDFTGNGETAIYQQNAIKTEPYANLENGAFFPPLLDDGGVKGFKNVDLTKNLLAYTQINAEQGHENDACNVTDVTVAAALGEIAYQEGNATGDGYVAGKAAYRTVALSDPQYITGHWIQKSGNDYIAQRDHQLVDKQDFNAPVSYRFADGKRMWYQRMPDNYAGQEHDMDANGKPVFRQDAGWESISLPFTAELVTTDVKGEITHFYGNHTKDHEYWLREYKGKVDKSQVTGNNTDAGTFVADFRLPAATDTTRTVNNTFLWDYYYEATAGHNLKDKNNDTYQNTYYSIARTYEGYPLLQGGTPYIIGFPGARYYEFDLSGGFEAFPTTATYQSERPEVLSKQTITFASNVGATIGVSDTEMNNVTAQAGYYHRPNYLNIEMPAGGYVMSKDGDAYNQMTADDVTAKTNKVSAFRTYFSTLQKPQMAARRIVFNRNYEQLGNSDFDIQEKFGEGLDIRPGKQSVIVTSHLKYTADVRIFNVSGLCLASFNIEPGQTVKTTINFDGVYIVDADGSRYVKKVMLK